MILSSPTPVSTRTGVINTDQLVLNIRTLGLDDMVTVENELVGIDHAYGQ